MQVPVSTITINIMNNFITTRVLLPFINHTYVSPSPSPVETSGLTPAFGYFKMNIYVHVFMWAYIFISLGSMPSSTIAGSYGSLMFRFFFKRLPNCFPEWLYHFTFPPAIHEWSSSSAFLPAFCFVTISPFSHSDRCVVSYDSLYKRVIDKSVALGGRGGRDEIQPTAGGMGGCIGEVWVRQHP